MFVPSSRSSAKGLSSCIGLLSGVGGNKMNFYMLPSGSSSTPNELSNGEEHWVESLAADAMLIRPSNAVLPSSLTASSLSASKSL
jgi:hypothetical protein